jgi:tRNA (guanine37-N1)-methyltransferase
MRFDVVTLFPDLFGPHLSQGVTRRAFESKQVDVRLWQLRDFADDNYRRVDDRPYGGGPGMVMLAEPLLRALAAIEADRAAHPAAEAVALAALPVVNFTPTGQPLTQALVRRFASGPGAVLLCGRYEGIDQRFLDAHATHHISLGDFVLSGGELPALALLDAVARLQDGVLTAPSHLQDSFSDGAYGLLEGPSYSRPETLQINGTAQAVPPVLLSGHHGDIARYKRESSLLLTARNRPDLLQAARAASQLSPADERFLRQSGL